MAAQASAMPLYDQASRLRRASSVEPQNSSVREPLLNLVFAHQREQRTRLCELASDWGYRVQDKAVFRTVIGTRHRDGDASMSDRKAAIVRVRKYTRGPRRDRFLILVREKFEGVRASGLIPFRRMQVSGTSGHRGRRAYT